MRPSSFFPPTLKNGRRGHATSGRRGQTNRVDTGLRTLPAGRYLAIAVDYLEEGEEHNPDLLKEWVRNATSFTLGDGETRTVNLRVTESALRRTSLFTFYFSLLTSSTSHSYPVRSSTGRRPRDAHREVIQALPLHP